MRAKIGRIYKNPSNNEYYVIVAYRPNGAFVFSSSVYEGYNIKDPDKICFCAVISVEKEWELLDEDPSW